jgi:hypothetical protein
MEKEKRINEKALVVKILKEEGELSEAFLMQELCKRTDYQDLCQNLFKDIKQLVNMKLISKRCERERMNNPFTRYYRLSDFYLISEYRRNKAFNYG